MHASADLSEAQSTSRLNKLPESPSNLMPLPLNKMVVYRHPYSRHDNKHSLQDNGAYLDKGLGRRKTSDHKINQHHSFDLISWRDSSSPKPPLSHRSTYYMSYSSSAPTSRSLQSTFNIELPSLRKFHVVTKGDFHRFPHKHRLPPSPETCSPTTNTIDWFGKSMVTPLHVLAQTQQPFAKKNLWNYSYKYR